MPVTQALLLGLDGGFDLSALQWFGRTATLPAGARVVVQRPGEVCVYPASALRTTIVELETTTVPGPPWM